MKDNSAHVGNKNFRTFLLLTVVGLIAISCSPAPTPTTTATLQPSATITLTPAPSPTPTATPFPGLSTDGPYLVFERYIGEQREFIFYDYDGKGRKIVPVSLPEGAMAFIDDLSPDGNWLAFYTGSAGDYGSYGIAENQATTEFNLALNVMNLADGSIVVTIPLLQENFLNSFQEAAKVLNERGISIDELGGIEDMKTADVLQSAFACGIQSLAWSRDSRYLAFAGQMEGWFSDIYVYDLAERTIQRITNGMAQIQHISWSSDGKLLIYGTDNNTIGYNYWPNLHVVSMDRSVAMDIPGEYIQTWLDSSSFLTSANMAGLSKVDVLTQSSEIFWSGDFIDLALDRENNTLALTDIYDDETEDLLHMSLFLLDLETGEIKTRIEDISDVVFIGNGENRFLAFETISQESYGGSTSFVETGKVYFVRTDGSVADTEFPIMSSYIATVSPTKRYIMFDDIDTPSGSVSQVFTVDGIFINETPTRHTVSLFWRSDSDGLFLFDSSQNTTEYPYAESWYTIDLVSGDFTLIDTIFSDEYIGSRWIVGK